MLLKVEYMTNKSQDREVRLERLRPRQIDAAIAELPAIYVPCGSIEWHGRQNPVGLDTLKAHRQLIELAVRIGGLVYPPVFLGAGGGHLEFPHTYMVDSENMGGVLSALLGGFERDGFKTAVLLSGHYPNKKEFFGPAVKHFRDQGGTMKVISLIEVEVDGVNGDHAALFETSYMMYLMPELVRMGELSGSSESDIGGPDERRDWKDPIYADHPCYGIVGIDPRNRASADIGRENTERLVAHLSKLITDE